MYCTTHDAGACYEGCPDAYGEEPRFIEDVRDELSKRARRLRLEALATATSRPTVSRIKSSRARGLEDAVAVLDDFIRTT